MPDYAQQLADLKARVTSANQSVALLHALGRLNDALDPDRVQYIQIAEGHELIVRCGGDDFDLINVELARALKFAVRSTVQSFANHVRAELSELVRPIVEPVQETRSDAAESPSV